LVLSGNANVDHRVRFEPALPSLKHESADVGIDEPTQPLGGME